MAPYLLGSLALIITVFTLSTLFYFSYQKKHPYLLWFLGAFVYNCFTISLFYVFLPVPWIENIALQYFGITLFIIGGALVAGLSFLVTPFTLRCLSFCPKLSHPLLIALAFFTEDVLRSFLVSIFLYGDGASIGLHFILGSLGETLAFTPLIIFAYRGGVFFLSAILGLFVYLFFATLKKFLPLPIFFSYIVLFAFIYVFLLERHLPALHPISVGVLTTDWQNPSKENPKEDFRKRALTIEATLEGNKDVIDLLILPESTSYLDAKQLIPNSKEYPVSYYLDSTTIPKRGDYYTASVFYDKKADLTEIRRKDSLMVFSEYHPYLYDILSSLLLKKEGGAQLIYKKSDDYHTFSLGNLSFGALICSEGTSFMPLFHFEKKNPDFYTLQSNLVVMHKRSYGFMHLYAYTRLIAATTGKPVLGVSNGAPSYGFDGLGRPLYSLVPGFSLTKIKIP